MRLDSTLRLPGFWPRPPWYGGDLQTLRNYLLRLSSSLDPWPGERIEFPVGDGSGDVLLASLHRPAPVDGAARAEAGRRPLVVLIHGLSGCEDSAYLRASARHLLEQGFPVLRLNQRGAGPSRVRCRQQYHAGRSGDLDAVLGQMDGQLAGNGLCLAGFSLGGNVLLKYLGEHGRRAPVLAAASVSAPIDLAAAQRRLMARRNRVYHDYMLAGMQAGFAATPDLSDDLKSLAQTVRDVRAFDDQLTAPLNGFAGVDDYYENCKAIRFMAAITVPTLVIHARNDPWIPAKPYRRFDWRANPRLIPLLPRGGGHVGFHGLGGRAAWHDRCIAAFFARMAGG
jgi:predicted alpha/beta-fold hydrolase